MNSITEMIVFICIYGKLSNAYEDHPVVVIRTRRTSVESNKGS